MPELVACSIIRADTADAFFGGSKFVFKVIVTDKNGGIYDCIS
ncbi:hypothetical protein GCWU000342_01656 [Shuttleworthella satelles DSM 14600]|uniref:Uncharacterized protein n=1 Tax=Shuttleworthella satelles DSM 14600 TaxID=626523 RepID=C4GCG2_9FIRM|nr:hypothetical protein GCWU000342_01656 [Shuttleworthia satelles DSM 14600]